MQPIAWDDFTRVELRVGRVLRAEVFREARKPAYVLQIDFGEEIGQKKSSAQLTLLYRPEELGGKLGEAVVNFPRKQIGPLMSECLLTGFHNDKGEVVLCLPDKPVPPGTNWFEPLRHPALGRNDKGLQRSPFCVHAGTGSGLPVFTLGDFYRHIHQSGEDNEKKTCYSNNLCLQHVKSPNYLVVTRGHRARVSAPRL